jgi:hypothetical protein
LRIVPPEEARDPEHLGETEPVRLAPLPAPKRRRAGQETAELAKLRADEALQARLSAEEKAGRATLVARDAERARREAEAEAERANLAADEALRVRLALEREAHRAELAAEEAFKTWGKRLVAEEDAEPRPAEAAAIVAPDPPRVEPQIPVEPQPPQAAAMPEVTEQHDAEEPAPPPDSLTCQIVYWRGYRKSAFYARAFDKEGYEVALAESPVFKTRGKDGPDRTDDEAIAAHQALVAQLTSDGWELAGGGSTWFDQTLRRRIPAS